MKNKIIGLLAIIFFLINICSISYALENVTVYLESNYDVVKKGEEIEITVNLKEIDVVAFNFYMYFDNTKWDYISKIDNANVKDDHIIYVWHDITGGKSAKNGEIAKLKFKAKDDGLTTFTINGEFYNSSSQLIKTNFKEKQVQIGEEDNNLQSQAEEEDAMSTQTSNAYLQTLRLDKEGLTPSFNREIYEYYLTVEENVNEVELLTISENPNATIEITGNTKLKDGLNTIKIKVTSEDKKESKTYIINVTKTKNLALANTNLEVLAIENVLLTPPFDPNVTSYNAEVSKEINDINIFAVAENENAKVQINKADGLKDGNNLVTIIVTAENGFSKKKYDIEVHKRSKEEQAKYDEEEKKQAEKVEKAYKIEEVSNNRDDKIENKDNSKVENGKSRSIFIWAIVIVVVVIITAYIAIRAVKK